MLHSCIVKGPIFLDVSTRKYVYMFVNIMDGKAFIRFHVKPLINDTLTRFCLYTKALTLCQKNPITYTTSLLITKTAWGGFLTNYIKFMSSCNYIFSPCLFTPSSVESAVAGAKLFSKKVFFQSGPDSACTHYVMFAGNKVFLPNDVTWNLFCEELFYHMAK